MSSKINQKLEVITELQSELTTIRNKVSSIKRMMIDHHKLNIQNTKINLSFSENTNETENKDEFKTWIDLQREEMIKNNPLFMLFGGENLMNNKKIYSLEIDINTILLAQIIDTIIQNLLEREKVILFELRKLLK